MAVLPASGLEDHPDGTGSLNAIVNGNWRQIESWVNPAAGLTAAKAGTTVTASAAIFTSEHIGDVLRFASGVEVTITATGGTVAAPSTTCTVSISGTVTSQAFLIYAAVAESPRTLFARALTKKTKAANIAAGTTLVWDATAQKFKPGDPASIARVAVQDVLTGFSNSSAEQSILGVAAGVTVGANTLAANDQYRIEILGTLSTAAVPGTLTLRFKMAGVTVISVVRTPVANLVAVGFRIMVTMRATAIGAGGTFNAVGEFLLPDSSAVPQYWSFSNAGFFQDTTVGIALAVTAQFATANASNAINIRSSVVQKIAA